MRLWAVVLILSICVTPCLLSAGDTAARSARGVLHRLLPAHEKAFILEQIPADEGRDVFEIESRGDKIVLRGNNGVAMAAGLNWYLKYFCNCH